MRGIYPIVDTEALNRAGLDLLEFARAVLVVRPAILQLRAKRSSARDTLELLRALAPLTRSAGTKLYANDRPDLAELAGADGVHLGQGDLPPAEVRRHFPDLELGLSTHSLGELSAALELSPHYVAYGPVFPTHSKLAPEPTVGLTGLSEAARLVDGRFPLVAIGGVTLSNAVDVAARANLAAVIGELTGHGPDLGRVTQRARALHEKLGGAGD